MPVIRQHDAFALTSRMTGSLKSEPAMTLIREPFGLRVEHISQPIAEQVDGQHLSITQTRSSCSP